MKQVRYHRARDRLLGTLFDVEKYWYEMCNVEQKKGTDTGCSLLGSGEGTTLTRKGK